MIKFPIAVKRSDDARFAYLIDADDQVIAGAIHLEDAEQLVRAANAGANPLQKPTRRKNKREQIADKLRDSDPIAVIMGRDHEIIYGLLMNFRKPESMLPEFVRLNSRWRYAR